MRFTKLAERGVALLRHLLEGGGAGHLGGGVGHLGGCWGVGRWGAVGCWVVGVLLGGRVKYRCTKLYSSALIFLHIYIYDRDLYCIVLYCIVL